MEFNNVSLFLAVGIGILASYLGRYIRRRILINNTQKLIRDLETYFNQSLPYYKGSQDISKVNWDRVLKMLKNEPDTEKIQRLRRLVQKQMTVNISGGKTKR